MKTDDGGNAFPRIESDQAGSNGDYWTNTYSVGGMSLRDYFAAKAMQSFLVHGVDSAEFDHDAMQAYAMADEMLKARQS